MALLFCKAAFASSFLGNCSTCISISKSVSSISFLLGDNKTAFENYKNYIALKDAIFNETNNKKISGLETKRVEEINQKKLEIKDLEIAKAKTERIYFIAGIFLLILFLTL